MINQYFEENTTRINQTLDEYSKIAGSPLEVTIKSNPVSLVFWGSQKAISKLNNKLKPLDTGYDQKKGFYFISISIESSYKAWQILK